MRKYLYILLLILALSAALIAASDKGEISKKDTPKSSETVVIVTPKGCKNDSFERKTARAVADELTALGLYPLTTAEDRVNYDILEKSTVILIGDIKSDVKSRCSEPISCTKSPPKSKNATENDFFPMITPKTIARASMLLLPKKAELSIVSNEKGAEIMIVSKDKAVTVATFAVDVDRLAKAVAAKAYSRISGEELHQKADSYYTLYINKAASERFGCDTDAVSEDFCTELTD